MYGFTESCCSTRRNCPFCQRLWSANVDASWLCLCLQADAAGFCLSCCEAEALHQEDVHMQAKLMMAYVFAQRQHLMDVVSEHQKSKLLSWSHSALPCFARGYEPSLWLWPEAGPEAELRSRYSFENLRDALRGLCELVLSALCYSWRKK